MKCFLINVIAKLNIHMNLGILARGGCKNSAKTGKEDFWDVVYYWMLLVMDVVNENKKVLSGKLPPARCPLFQMGEIKNGSNYTSGALLSRVVRLLLLLVHFISWGAIHQSIFLHYPHLVFISLPVDLVHTHAKKINSNNRTMELKAQVIVGRQMGSNKTRLEQKPQWSLTNN